MIIYPNDMDAAYFEQQFAEHLGPIDLLQDRAILAALLDIEESQAWQEQPLPPMRSVTVVRRRVVKVGPRLTYSIDETVICSSLRPTHNNTHTNK